MVGALIHNNTPYPPHVQVLRQLWCARHSGRPPLQQECLDQLKEGEKNQLLKSAAAGETSFIQNALLGLFGDMITVHRGVSGAQADQIRAQTTNGVIEILNSGPSSWTIDKNVANRFALKGVILTDLVPHTDIVAAPMLTAPCSTAEREVIVLQRGRSRFSQVSERSPE